MGKDSRVRKELDKMYMYLSLVTFIINPTYCRSLALSAASTAPFKCHALSLLAFGGGRSGYVKVL